MADIKGLDPEIPPKPSITVTIERGGEEDMVWLTQCVDPLFDAQILSEGLATAIVVAAKYTEKPLEEVLQEVVHKLEEAVRWHGTIKRSE